MMRIRTVLLGSLIVAGLLLSACSKSDPPAPAATAAKPQPPPPPPPPPETTFGTLVSAELTNGYPTWVLSAGCRGGMCEEMVKPPKGKVVYRFHFEGKKADALPSEKKMSLTDSAQKKYSVSASKEDKSAVVFYFVVPETATGLTWSDGEKTVPLEAVLKKTAAAGAGK
ncbi:MAG TPA: hypothetical protein VLA96_04490 [Terriglobales bacterium]|nr:hypothetical protein [Terriglobales bacterium]